MNHAFGFQQLNLWMWLLTNGLKSWTPGCIIHHDFGELTYSLNAEANFRHAYSVTGHK